MASDLPVRVLRRARDDAGVVVVVVAATIAALLIVASMVIDLGGARHARERDQDTADAMALAAAANLDASGATSQNACNAAWNYAMTNLGLASSPAPSCVTMAGSCDGATPRSVAVTSGDYIVTLINPVLNSSTLFTGQSATTSDASPCDRFGVTLQHTWHALFESGATTISVKALGMRTHGTGDVYAPLIILDPHACETLTLTGNSHVTTSTPGGAPGYIAIDSDGASCPAGKKVILDTTGNAQITAGGIAMWALATGNTARAYDPADVGVGRAINPAPIASSAPVGRSAVDWRYNCLISNGCPSGQPSAIQQLVTAQGTGTPTGFTRWTSVYSCSPGSDMVVPKGNWYVDCASGLTSSAKITFRGGNIVSDGSFTMGGNGELRVNCDVASVATACPTNPATPSTFFIRSGGLSKAGNVSLTLLETFVYLANGTINLTGNSQLTWTAPDDATSSFNDLLVWNEGSSAVTLQGNASTQLDGIFFSPNAPLSLTGNSGVGALASQMFVRTAALTGNSSLTLSPRDDRMMQLGGNSAALIR